MSFAAESKERKEWGKKSQSDSFSIALVGRWSGISIAMMDVA